MRAAADHLEGDWLIVGGAVVALCYDDTRTTADVDFVAFDEAASPYALYELAEQLGHPIETFNPAAGFFVRRIAGWRERTTKLAEGARGRIHRADATLLILSKLARLSEQDLADCLAAIGSGEELDRACIMEALEGAVSERAEALRVALGGAQDPAR